MLDGLGVEVQKSDVSSSRQMRLEVDSVVLEESKGVLQILN